MILPNATKYTNKFDKRFPQNKIEQVFLGRSAGLEGWKWTAIDFGQDIQKSKLPL